MKNMMSRLKNSFFNINFLKELMILIIIGVIIGLLIGVYQLFLTYVVGLNSFFYSSTNIYVILGFLAIAIVLSILNFMLLSYAPGCSGSGIPSLKLANRDNSRIGWIKDIPIMFINSCNAIFLGFPLGSEGPSVVMASKISTAVQDLTNIYDEEINELSEGVGFGCAFLSPLAGISYALEEGKRKFKFKSFLKVFLLMIIAFLITKLINHHHLLSIENVINFDLNFFFVLIEILIINVGLGHFFIKFNTFLKRITKKYSNNFFIKYRSFFVTPIIILLSFFTINMTGAGGKIISSISTYTIISYIIFVLLFRFLNINVAANSNVTGGLIVPILSLGALSGQIINIYATRYQNFDQSNWPIVILISSIMLFSLIIKTPITGTILLYSTISYLTNDYLSSLIYIPVIFIIYFIGTIFSKRILKDNCLYDELLLENDVNN